MTKLTLEVPESLISEVSAIYAGKAEYIINRFNILREEWISLEPSLKKIGLKYQSPFEELKTSNGYNPFESWLNKSIYFMEKEGRPLTSKEIISLVSEIEPNINKGLLINSIPATLSVAARNGRITRTLNNYEWIYSIKKK